MSIYKNKGVKAIHKITDQLLFYVVLVNVLTSILNERLNTFLDEFNVLHENQTGFKKSIQSLLYVC